MRVAAVVASAAARDDEEDRVCRVYYRLLYPPATPTLPPTNHFLTKYGNNEAVLQSDWSVTGSCSHSPPDRNDQSGPDTSSLLGNGLQDELRPLYREESRDASFLRPLQLCRFTAAAPSPST